MRVLATRRSIDEETPDVDVDRLVPVAQTHDVVAQSDWIVLCSQLTDETRGFIDAGLLAAMKPGSVFVNIARGEEVDEMALVEAVRSGHLRGALLDVHAGESEGLLPRQELLDTPGIIMTPHLAGSGQRGAGRLVRQLFADNLGRYLSGAPLLNQVDRERGY